MTPRDQLAYARTQLLSAHAKLEIVRSRPRWNHMIGEHERQYCAALDDLWEAQQRARRADMVKAALDPNSIYGYVTHDAMMLAVRLLAAEVFG